MWKERHALFQSAAQQVDVAQMGVDFLHEGFQAAGGRTVGKTELEGHSGLKRAAEGFFRPASQVVQLRPNAQQIVVGRGEFPVFLRIDDLVFQQFFHGLAAFLEERHPQQVLVVAQAAAAVLDIRFLHVGGVAEFFAAGVLVFQPGGDIALFVAGNAFEQQGPGHLVE